jgi:CHAD domain-containing protein
MNDTFFMNKKQLKHITGDHYRLLKKHIKKVTENFDADAIHQFRVAYKKLRAFLRMISAGNKKGRKIKISKKLQQAYSIAGSIRDLQLQQERIRLASSAEYKRPQDYLDRLQQTIELYKPGFAEVYLENPVDKCKKKTDGAMPDEFSFHLFSDFVTQKWTSVFTITKYRRLRDDQIHAIRKHLKDLFYNLKVYDDAEKVILSTGIWKNKDEAYYFQLLDQLGRFQDTCMSISYLDKKWVNGLNSYNRALLARVKKSWLKDKRQLKQMLLNKLSSGISGQYVLQ